METLFEAVVGFAAGLLGGLFGVGGSVLIIPGLIFYLSQTPRGYHGSEQHLIQAAAMVCNVFVAAPGLVAHLRARAVLFQVLLGLLPGAIAGMVAGVVASNSPLFARERGAYLAMVLAVFLAAEGLSHLQALGKRGSQQKPEWPSAVVASPWRTFPVGIVVGFIGGLLGIGGGTLSIPLQYRLLRVPLRSAIANSAACIVVVSTLGAVYKTLSLPSHGFTPTEALRLAALIIPTAIVGSYLGGQLTHRISRWMLEVLLVVFFLSMAGLTYSRAMAAVRGHTTRHLEPQVVFPHPHAGAEVSPRLLIPCSGALESKSAGTVESGTVRSVPASAPNCRSASNTAIPTLTARFRLRASGRRGIRTTREA